MAQGTGGNQVEVEAPWKPATRDGGEGEDGGKWRAKEKEGDHVAVVFVIQLVGEETTSLVFPDQ